MLQTYDFEKLLNKHHLANINPETKQVLYGFFVARGIEYKEAYSFLNGAKKRAILSKDNGEWVKLNIVDLVKNHSSSADIELYKRIDEIDKKFKEFYINNRIKAVQTDNVFKTVMRAVKKQNQLFNDDLCNFTSEELDMIYNVACIYNSLNNTFGVNGLHEADDIITRGLAKSIEKNKTLNKRLQNGNKFASDVEKLLKTLTTDNGALPANEQFAPDDVKHLLTQTLCLLYTTNKIKADKTREILRNYLENLKELAKDRPEEKEFLDKATAKSIILRAGTILKPSPVAIQESLDLLMGKRVGEITLPKSNRDKENQEIGKLYPNLHIEGFNLDKHLYMIQNRVTLIPKLSLKSLSTAQNQIIDGMARGLIKNADALSVQEKIARLAKLGVDTDRLIHADNVAELVIMNPLNELERRVDFSQNIKLLSKILPVSDLQKLVRHNIALLCQPNLVIESNVYEIVNSSKRDMNKCQQEMEQFVNSRFSLTDSNSRETSKEKGQHDVPVIDVEEFDVDDNKNYIKLNLVKLRAQMTAETQITHTPYLDTITAENYDNMLYQELVTLGKYLDSKETSATLSLASDSLGGMLNKINRGKASQAVNGALKTRLLGITKMLNYLSTETSKKEGTERGILQVLDKVNNRLSVLESEINSTTMLADEMFLSDTTRRPDNSERLNEYRQVLELAKQTIQGTKSKALLKRLMQDCEFYESQILELQEQNKKISDDRSDYVNLYADRANLLEEQRFLKYIAGILDGAVAKQPVEQQLDSAVESSDVSDTARIEGLKALIENRTRRLKRTVNAEQARKLKEGIEKLQEELYGLEHPKENV